MQRILIMLIFASIYGCNSYQAKTNNEIADEENTIGDATKITVKHAEGFKILQRNGVFLLEIKDPQNPMSEPYKFALANKNTHADSIPAGYTPIAHPAKGIICMTTLQLSNFIKLKETDAVVGISSTRHLFNKDLKDRIEKGQTRRIGIEGNFDSELIMGINPDLILISPYKRGGYERLKDTNIPLVPHLGYKEKTPLGQAEWIKFVGLLLGKPEKADSIFETIENDYNRLKSMAAKAQYRPLILSGESRGSGWYAPGGRSFLAQMFSDAGANYFLNDDTDSGGKNLDFEVVYQKAANADYWRILNSYKGDFTYKVLAEEDCRYEDFRAFKNKSIIYCNMSKKPFYESMPTEPEIILADFIHIFHPELLPNHTPTYYSLMK